MRHNDKGNRARLSRGARPPLSALGRVLSALLLSLLMLLPATAMSALAVDPSEPAETTQATADAAEPTQGPSEPVQTQPSSDPVQPDATDDPETDAPSAPATGEPTTGSDPSDEPDEPEPTVPATTTSEPEIEVGPQSDVGPQGDTPSLCQPSTIYGVTLTGSVYSAPETGGTATGLGGWYTLYTNWRPTSEGLNQGSLVPTPDGANGLAIAADGTMYAYARYYQYDKNYPSTKWNVSIKMMVKEPDGPWRWLDTRTYRPTTYAYSYNTSAGPIAGAIDPNTGKYVWGGFKSGYFQIHEIDLTTGVRNVTGRVYVGHSGTNGDIAFDPVGNLYIAAHSGTTGVLTITTVTAADLAAGRLANQGYTNYDAWPSIIPGSIARATESGSYGSQVNGIAVGENGGLYIGTNTQVYEVNPVTARIIGGAVTTNPYTQISQDLTSCAGNAPTTLTVQKDLKSGWDHEFKLSVAHNGTEVTSTTAKTKVAGTTILREKVGPTMVSPGDELTLTESSANLSRYESTLSCRIDGVDGAAGVVTVGGSGTTSGTITIPEQAEGRNITCTFVNAPPVTETVCPANTLYSIDWDTSLIKKITLGTNGAVNSGVTTADVKRLSNTTVTHGYNALALSLDGTTLWASDQGTGRNIYRLDLASGNVTTFTNAWNFQTPGYGDWAPGYLAGTGLIGGAVNPQDGLYYAYNYLTGYLYAFHTSGPDIGKAVGLVGRINITSNGLNGQNVSDIAFDKAGNLFFTANTNSGKHSLYRVTGPISSTSGVQTLVPQLVSATVLNNSPSIGSLAFGSNGNLYLGTSIVSPQIQELNPANGQVITATTSMVIAGNPVDFASCSTPSTLTVEKVIVDRFGSTDQFTYGVAGGNLSAPARVDSSGSTTGLQDQVAGPVVVTPGSSYTISETAKSGSLDNYWTTYSCVTESGAEVARGDGASFTYTQPAGTGNAGDAVTCTFTNTPIPRTPFVCAAGEVYALDGYFSTEGGAGGWTALGGTASIRQVNTANGALSIPQGNFGQVTANNTSNPKIAGQANAFGISPDGTSAYAAVVGDSGGTSFDKYTELRRYDAASGHVSPVAILPNGLGHSLVAGAVDPSTGDYWVAGRLPATSERWAFTMYSPHDGTASRQFVLDFGRPAGNGDLLFDSQGNLYVLTTQGAGVAENQNLWMVPAASVQAAVADDDNAVLVEGAEILTQLTDDPTRTYHSAAWGNDGYIYLGASRAIWANSTYPSSLYRLNPVTGVVTLVSVMADSSSVVDFASCASPYTVTLKKNIAERASGSDQFGLRIGGGGIAADSVIAYGETSGSSTGLQDYPSAVAGAIPVLPGGEYTITEAGILPTDLGKYGISYECRDLSQPGRPVFSEAANVTSLPVTLPAMPSNNGGGADIECVFTNMPFEIELTKVDAEDHDLVLEGATFQLWKDVNSNGTLETDIDTKVGGEQTTDASGLITWNTGLAAGPYLLQEIAAPDGYANAVQITPVTIVNGHTTVTIENTRRTGTVTWGKTDNSTPGNRLSGSEWTLTGPEGANSTELVVVDCVGAAPADCATQPDKDHRAGYFEVTGLAWGAYELRETKAPAGYLLSGQIHEFEIGPEAGQSFAEPLGDFVNHQQPALVIPLTGGLGTDLFLAVGGGFLLLLIAGYLYQRRRGLASVPGLAMAAAASDSPDLP